MSTFKVLLTTIREVALHSNADRLELAKVDANDYQFVVVKGAFVPGSQVVYFPIDSVLPQNLIETLGLVGRLAGSAQNRIKTVRLRGEISQGIVASPEILPQWGAVDYRVGDNLAELLGVTKYEPPVIPSHAGNLVRLPQSVSVYDIENSENHRDATSHLMRLPAYITEKLEGSHWAATLDTDGVLTVSQRHHAIQPIEDKEHDWIRVANEMDMRGKLEALRDQLSPSICVTIRGEMVGPGIQGNYYDLKRHTVFVFEIERDGVPVSAHEFLNLSELVGLQVVPVLCRGEMTLGDWLSGRSLREACTANSCLAPAKLREGIVIRPFTSEASMPMLGRLILKARSPEYLVGSDT